jgi:hypothetical protein
MEFAKTTGSKKGRLSQWRFYPFSATSTISVSSLNHSGRNDYSLRESAAVTFAGYLCLSEVMTIIVMFHASAYRNFKAYYTEQVLKHYTAAFPHLTSYQRFVELMPQTLVPLYAYLQTRKGECSGISFVDSTCVKVCHNRRIHSHKVFAGCARRGKTSVDWFFGFKLHLVINDCGELLSFRLTPGNVDDRRPVPERQCCENYIRAQKVTSDSFSGSDLKERSNELRLSLRITPG